MLIYLGLLKNTLQCTYCCESVLTFNHVGVSVRECDCWQTHWGASERVWLLTNTLWCQWESVAVVKHAMVPVRECDCWQTHWSASERMWLLTNTVSASEAMRLLTNTECQWSNVTFDKHCDAIVLVRECDGSQTVARYYQSCSRRVANFCHEFLTRDASTRQATALDWFRQLSCEEMKYKHTKAATAVGKTSHPSTVTTKR